MDDPLQGTEQGTQGHHTQAGHHLLNEVHGPCQSLVRETQLSPRIGGALGELRGGGVQGPTHGDLARNTVPRDDHFGQKVHDRVERCEWYPNTPRDLPRRGHRVRLVF